MSDEQAPIHVSAVTYKWPTNLKTAKEAADALGLPEARLISLADDGYAPHWRLDGGAPLFILSELKDWAAGSLIRRYDGKPLPGPEVIIVSGDPIHRLLDVPASIRTIVGLKAFPRAHSGIYFLCLGNEVVYVGQSVNPVSRIDQHGYERDRIYFLPWPSDDLDRIEGALIRALKPKHNSTSPGMKSAGDDQAVLELVGFGGDPRREWMHLGSNGPVALATPVNGTPI